MNTQKYILASAFVSSLLGNIPSALADSVDNTKNSVLEIIAGDITKCGGTASVEMRTKWRTPGGNVISQAPAITESINASCGNFSGYVWGIQDTITQQTKEVDFGVRYAFPQEMLPTGFKAGVGLERYALLADGGHIDVIKPIFSINQFLPIDVSLEISHIIGGSEKIVKGTQYIPKASKTFALGKIDVGNTGVWETKATFDVAMVCENKFLGNTGCPNNIIAGATFTISQGDFSVSVRGEHHDGKNGRKDDNLGFLTVTKRF